eukprot:6670661-Pyramimonas_sp.AAC.2
MSRRKTRGRVSKSKSRGTIWIQGPGNRTGVEVCLLVHLGDELVLLVGAEDEHHRVLLHQCGGQVQGAPCGGAEHCVGALPWLQRLEVRRRLVVQEVEAVVAGHADAAPMGSVHDSHACRARCHIMLTHG